MLRNLSTPLTFSNSLTKVSSSSIKPTVPRGQEPTPSDVITSHDQTQLCSSYRPRTRQILPPPSLRLVSIHSSLMYRFVQNTFAFCALYYDIFLNTLNIKLTDNIFSAHQLSTHNLFPPTLHHQAPRWRDTTFLSDTTSLRDTTFLPPTLLLS